MNIGIDIVEVKRIARLIKDRNFLERVFTADEIKYCLKRKNKAEHFAVRFATKEAVWKAVRRPAVALRDIGVKNLPDGKPRVFLKNKYQKNIDVSLSHTAEYAVSVAIVK
jgi:holo-[acyl-carrier protein] synthase